MPQKNQAILTARSTQLTNSIVVFLGDSLTAGFGVDASQAYPALIGRFWKDMGLPYASLNAGVSGDTTADVLRRLDKVLTPPPSLIILAIGANDAFGRVPLDEIKQNIILIIKQARGKGSNIVLSSMQFSPQYLGNDVSYTEKFNSLYAQVGRQERVTVLPPLLRSLFNRADLWLPDNLHPTPEGHRLIARDMLKDLNPEWIYPGS